MFSYGWKDLLEAFDKVRDIILKNSKDFEVCLEEKNKVDQNVGITNEIPFLYSKLIRRDLSRD